MPRISNGTNLNIAQLEQILNERKSLVGRLQKQRADLQKKLDALDREIEKVGGTIHANRTASGRARNEKSLPEALEDVLRGAGRPMKVGEITDAVMAAGYKSTSDSFRAIVNQTLIKDRKRFLPTPNQRGMYQVKGSK